VVWIDPGFSVALHAAPAHACRIKTLFDYVEGGDTLDFFDQFPSLSRAQAIQLFEDSQRALPAA